VTAHEIVEDLLTESPKVETLKKHKRPLSPEEQAKVAAVKLPHGDCATFWKAEHEGKTWYVVHTHRAGQVRPSLKSALAVYPKIASTA
jgi:hypothetical protein